MPRSADFSLPALYEALDAQRQARSLSWRQAVLEMSEPFVRGRSRPLSPSTVVSTRTKAVAEGDGVLQMLRWLNRTPESFIPGHPQAADEEWRFLRWVPVRSCASTRESCTPRSTHSEKSGE